MKSSLSRRTPFLASFLLALSLSISPAHAEPTLKQFVTKGTQYKQLAYAFWQRLWHSNAGFESCVRRLYTKEELIGHPLSKDSYGLLDFFKKSATSERANTFSFLNSHGEAWRCEIQGGYCMGMSSLARDLNLLLIFDPTQSLGKLPKFASQQKKSEYFEKILFDVWTQKKPAVIPGYADLFSFSSDPTVKNIFMSAVPMSWGDHAAIPEIAMGVLSKSRRHIDNAEIIEQMDLLKTAKEREYNPLMYLGGVEGGSPKIAHASRGLQVEGTSLSGVKPGLDHAPNEAEVQAAIDQAKGLSTQNPARSLESTRAASHSISDAFQGATDSDHTYIHVVQVLKVKEVTPRRKWIITAIDPNGYAPNNVGTLTVDLDAKQKIYFKGASAELELNSFGQLPGDVEHVDEIMSNLILYAKTHPNIFAAEK